MAGFNTPLNTPYSTTLLDRNLQNTKILYTISLFKKTYEQARMAVYSSEPSSTSPSITLPPSPSTADHTQATPPQSHSQKHDFVNVNSIVVTACGYCSSLMWGGTHSMCTACKFACHKKCRFEKLTEYFVLHTQRTGVS